MKMVLMNLFPGKESRCRYREQTAVTGGEGECGTNGESNTDIYTLSCVKQIGVRSCDITHGAQPDTL